MSDRPVIAVDAMGGDFGPSVVVPGAIEAARLHDLHVLLVGDTPKLETELQKIDLANVHFDIVQADDVVHMNEKPSDILRRKKNASIQVACPSGQGGQRRRRGQRRSLRRHGGLRHVYHGAASRRRAPGPGRAAAY